MRSRLSYALTGRRRKEDEEDGDFTAGWAQKQIYSGDFGRSSQVVKKTLAGQANSDFSD